MSLSIKKFKTAADSKHSRTTKANEKSGGHNAQPEREPAGPRTKTAAWQAKSEATGKGFEKKSDAGPLSAQTKKSTKAPAPKAIDTQQKALAYLTDKGGAKARWTVRLGVEPKNAQHSLTNVYANGKYVGSLQLYLMGPALYNNAKIPGYKESAPVKVSWDELKAGVAMTYKEDRPWGAGWICHDFSAKLFKSLGKEVENPSATAKGPLYIGGRVLGTLLSPGAGVAMAAHRGFNNLKDGKEGIARGWEQEQRALNNVKKLVSDALETDF
jgi:hypothetical protein